MTADSKESIRMAVDGGLDVQGFDFSNSFWEKSLVSLVEEGKLEESVMDEAVSRVLRVKFELGLFENPYTEETHYKDVVRCENTECSAFGLPENLWSCCRTKAACFRSGE